MATEISKEKANQQYRAWGVAVQTSNVRPVHIANGLVQLLRLADEPPTWKPDSDDFVAEYVSETKARLQTHLNLKPEVRALSVMSSKNYGPLLLSAKLDREPPFLTKSRDHFRRLLRIDGADLPTPEQQRALADVINADGKVLESGGADPTTPGLSLAGFTDTHTLKGMHAATFLGLLAHTERGCEALARLYKLMSNSRDAHSRLVEMLELDEKQFWPSELTPAALMGRYPLPSGHDWSDLAHRTGRMTHNILAWSDQGAAKAETLMAVVDLAALLLSLRLLRWLPSTDNGSPPDPPRLLLLLSPLQIRSDLRHATVRAQQSLQTAAAALDDAAADLIIQGAGKAKQLYRPSIHALNLGAAGGWLFPLHAQGGAKRYFRPGSRQLTTLVHGLLAPGEELPWPDFADQAESLGLAIGGPNEHRTEQRLQIGALSDSLRRIGQANRDHLVALGLARRESDNVVIIDGGAP